SPYQLQHQRLLLRTGPLTSHHQHQHKLLKIGTASGDGEGQLLRIRSGWKEESPQRSDTQSKSTTMSARFVVSPKLKTLAIPRYGENGTVHHLGRPLQSGRAPCKAVLYILYKVRIIVFYVVGMHRYHFFTNRYEYEYFYLCTCRYRVPIPILLRF